jgi:hypothetical protein
VEHARPVSAPSALFMRALIASRQNDSPGFAGKPSTTPRNGCVAPPLNRGNGFVLETKERRPEMKTILSSSVIFGAAALAFVGFGATPASAQATRTWVSGVGDDLNPCSRTAPCKTFAGAISKTAAAGEINCLDPAAYGAVTINKALSIICQYTEAGVLATLGTNAITVNAGATDSVTLSGIDFEGAGTGLNGIRFIAGGALHVENSRIHGFGAVNGQGISFRPTGASRLYVTNVTIAENGNGATGGGVFVSPTGTGSANVVFQNVRIQNNANTAFRVDSASSPGAISGLLDTVQFTGSPNGLAINAPVGSGPTGFLVTGSIVEQNTSFGISLAGPNANARFGTTSVTGNGTGVSATGGSSAASYGDNLLDSNGTNGAFTGVVIVKH